MGLRREGREAALQILYGFELAGQDGNVEAYLCHFWQAWPPHPEVKGFAEELVRGTLSCREEIDRLIGRCADNWDINRIAIIDKNILRFSVYEILHLSTIPHNVTINEAIEIAKKYGDVNSGEFVNGVLDRVVKEVTCDT